MPVSLFFSPHCDDVVLSCGGFIDALVRESKPVEVVTVFAGTPGVTFYSAFARHLHGKWRADPGSVAAARRREDQIAFQTLGVSNVEYWDLLEATYRTDASGLPLYASYDELSGSLRQEDLSLPLAVSQRIKERVQKPESTRLYFPLSVGAHVDHQILFRAGVELLSIGFQVMFYEDWPYVENYALAHSEAWKPVIVNISTARKVEALCHYVSQLTGLGGSPTKLSKRVSRYAKRVGLGQPAERFWALDASRLSTSSLPLRIVRTANSRPKWLGLRRRRPRGLEDLLPIGSGLCLDWVSGHDRRRRAVERLGYTWIGMSDVHIRTRRGAQARATSLPIRSASVSAVLVQQPLPFDELDAVLPSIAGALEPGGVICGSTAVPVFREGLDAVAASLAARLRRAGLADVEIHRAVPVFSLAHAIRARLSHPPNENWLFVGRKPARLTGDS